MQRILIEISRLEHNRTLVEVIASNLKTSKSKAKKMLDARRVFVNRQRVWMAKHQLQKGDQVEIVIPRHKPSKTEILWKDSHYLVVNKPAGVLTDHNPHSLEKQLQQTFGKGVRAVHRLDRDTSGCLIFARSQKDKKAMIPLFRNQSITKIYRAIVIGKFPHSMETIYQDIDGESAGTDVKILDQNNRASYLELSIRTGRTHQIRRHLKSVRHPVAGDKSYRGSKLKDDLLRAIPRQMLHASFLAFSHPLTQKTVRVSAPTPLDLKNALRALHLK